MYGYNLHCWDIFTRKAVSRVRDQHTSFTNCTISNNNTFNGAALGHVCHLNYWRNNPHTSGKSLLPMYLMKKSWQINFNRSPFLAALWVRYIFKEIKWIITNPGKKSCYILIRAVKLELEAILGGNGIGRNVSFIKKLTAYKEKVEQLRRSWNLTTEKLVRSDYNALICWWDLTTVLWLLF